MSTRHPGERADAQDLDARAQLLRLERTLFVARVGFFVGAVVLLAFVSFAPGPATAATWAVRLAGAFAMGWASYVLARELHEPAPLLWALAPAAHFMLGVVVFGFLNLRARTRLQDDLRAGVGAGSDEDGA